MSASRLIGISILAGGLSRRMGQDKSLLKLGGSTFLTIIRRTARQLDFPVRTIRRDLVPRCGPLGGIYTALVTSRAEAELFLACDMPFIDATLLQAVRDRYLKTGRSVFTRSADRAGFPLLIPCAATAEIKKQIDRKDFSLQKLAAHLRAEFAEIGASESAKLMNINTPAELKAAD